MICVHCDFDFDARGTRKKLAGGKINECADCVEELGTETALTGRWAGCPYLHLKVMRHERIIEPHGITTSACTKVRAQHCLALIPQ